MIKQGGIIRLSVLLLVSLSLCCCTARNSTRTDKKESIDEPILISDSSFLYDGKTLEGWEITNFGPQGPVYVSGGSIILGMGEGCTGITWKRGFPETDYRVTLEAKRVSGNDFFCGMTFPVGKESCSLIIGGWGGPVVGLSSIDRKDASENETTRLMQFESDYWYRICLTVTGDTIKAYIDDALVVDFVKGGRTLSIRPEVELSKPFGIASWNTTAALRNIRLEKLKY